MVELMFDFFGGWPKILSALEQRGDAQFWFASISQNLDGARARRNVHKNFIDALVHRRNDIPPFLQPSVKMSPEDLVKSNRIIWILILVIVWTTISIVLSAPSGHSQEKSAVRSEATPPVANSIFGKHGVVDYDSVESLEASELERRKRVSKRYDNDGWVMKNPHPDDAKVGRVSEKVPPPIIPVKESDLVVVGKVTGASTRLSNNKTGIYTEFVVEVINLIKKNLSTDMTGCITTDRAGGVVRYPNGQMVLYEDSVEGLPEVGKEYILFLKSDKKTDNYAIITLYELSETNTIPLDSGRNFDEIKRMGKTKLLRAVREELSRQR